MSIIGKALKDAYKDFLTVSNNNSGLSTSTQNVVSGNGNASCISVSDDQLLVKPTNDDTTSALRVSTQGGTAILDVDSTNAEVKANGHYVNTQVQSFGMFDASPSAGYHYPLVASNGIQTASGEELSLTSFGNGTDPNTSLTLTTAPEHYMMKYWVLRQNITIDEVYVMCAADDEQNLLFHVMSYDITTGSSASAGDLANGTLLAHNGSTLITDERRISQTTLTIDSANVASGKVVLAFVESDATDDISVSMQLKYHFNA